MERNDENSSSEFPLVKSKSQLKQEWKKNALAKASQVPSASKPVLIDPA